MRFADVIELLKGATSGSGEGESQELTMTLQPEAPERVLQYMCSKCAVYVQYMCSIRTPLFYY
jgi:hypothetical protein